VNTGGKLSEKSRAVPANLFYDQINVGSRFQFETIIRADAGLKFAELTGDFNPLHVDDQFAKKTRFHSPVVHGMFLGGLISRLVGMHCPGRRSLWLSQNLKFRKPVHYGESVKVVGTVTAKTDIGCVVTLKTEILKGDEIVCDGEAQVMMLQESTE